MSDVDILFFFIVEVAVAGLCSNVSQSGFIFSTRPHRMIHGLPNINTLAIIRCNLHFRLRVENGLARVGSS